MTPEAIGQSLDWWAWLAANSEALRNLALTVAAVLGAIVGLPLLAWRTWNSAKGS